MYALGLILAIVGFACVVGGLWARWYDRRHDRQRDMARRVR